MQSKDLDKCSTLETLDGTVKSVVYRNDETGWTVLKVVRSRTNLLMPPEEWSVVGKTQAVWEGEDVHAEGHWVVDKTHGR